MADSDSTDALREAIGSPSITSWAPHAAAPIADVTSVTFDALEKPVDFPPLSQAMVPGDQVALAIDPNVPQLDQVIAGIVRSIGQVGASRIDAIVWDEADDQTMQRVRSVMPPEGRVVRHLADRRCDVRYLGADDQGNPIYLNRLLVDADLVVPVTVDRPAIESRKFLPGDPSGIFPMLADSASRLRYQTRRRDKRSAAIDDHVDPRSDSHPAWLLGVQMMLRVGVNQLGQISDVMAGSLSAVNSVTTTLPDQEQAFGLIVLDLREPPVAQSWHNVARAIRLVLPWTDDQATIVLWTDLNRPIGGRPPESSDATDSLIQDDQGDGDPDRSDEDFPPWDTDAGLGSLLASWMRDYRLLLRSQLPGDVAELTGFGVIETAQELERLSEAFDECLMVHCGHLCPSVVPTIAELGE